MLRSLEARLRAAFHELAKFGTVGALAFVVDVSLFNISLHVAPHKPLTAKVISTVVAASVAFVLNRAWSFRHRQRGNVHREYALFFVLNGIGLALALGCLGFSHYVLGLHSKLADNISANGFGLVLGTLFRFWSYRRYIWLAPDAVEAAADDGDAAAVAVLEDVADGTIHAPAEAVTPA
ncbi:MAG: GtrA family protein [Frankiales bacterium]|jgi:putative flippase GtrA|nr:GtrA family protein [Frankiales bacterium]